MTNIVDQLTFHRRGETWQEQLRNSKSAWHRREAIKMKDALIRAMPENCEYDSPGTKFSSRVMDEIEHAEKIGQTSRHNSFIVIPSSGIWRKIGNRTFYRLYGLHYFSKNDHPGTNGLQTALDKAQSRVFVKDGTYTSSTTATWKNAALFLEGESSKAVFQPGSDIDILTMQLGVISDTYLNNENLCSIENIKFADTSGNQTTKSAILFDLANNWGFSESYMRNVIFLDMFNGIMSTVPAGFNGLNGFARSFLSNIHFLGNSFRGQAMVIGNPVDCVIEDINSFYSPTVSGTLNGFVFRGPSSGSASGAFIHHCKFISAAASSNGGATVQCDNLSETFFDNCYIESGVFATRPVGFLFSGICSNDRLRNVQSVACQDGIQFNAGSSTLNFAGVESQVILENCRFFNNTRYGLNIASASIQRVLAYNSQIIANATANWVVTTAGQLILYNPRTSNVPGYGFAVATPAVPATTVALQNTTGYRVRIYFLTTGTVTVITITDPNGTAQAINTAITLPNEIVLDPLASITLTYTAAPTWKWYAE